MSNIYVQEPPTSGKVVLVTTLGELEIELWSKECPKACRNFIQLCLEGYYDNTIFHNVVPNFIAQGGDPSGTGHGGESIYGEPYKNELHSRLRFVRRGLVATANSGNNDNVSQFFFTLAPTPELKNKHTIFGRVSGNTVFNMMKFNDVDTDQKGRPLYPPQITRAEVILNPFPDIQPRTLAIAAPKPHESKLSKSKGTKNLQLLSFAGEDGSDAGENILESAIATKAKTSHDLLIDSVTGNLCQKSEPTFVSARGVKNTGESHKIDVETNTRLPDGAPGKEKLKSIKDEIKQVRQFLKHKQEVKKNSALIASLKNDADRNNDILKHFHEEKLKYAEKQRACIIKGGTRETDTLLRLESFRRRLHGASAIADGSSTIIEESVNEESESWLGHKLRFEMETPALAKDANTKDDKWFDIYDPRNALNKRRRQTPKSEKAKQAKLDIA